MAEVVCRLCQNQAAVTFAAEEWDSDIPRDTEGSQAAAADILVSPWVPGVLEDGDIHSAVLESIFHTLQHCALGIVLLVCSLNTLCRMDHMALSAAGAGIFLERTPLQDRGVSVGRKTHMCRLPLGVMTDPSSDHPNCRDLQD